MGHVTITKHNMSNLTESFSFQKKKKIQTHLIIILYEWVNLIQVIKFFFYCQIRGL